MPQGKSLGKYTVDNGEVSFSAPTDQEFRAGRDFTDQLLRLYMDTLGSDIGVSPQFGGMIASPGNADKVGRMLSGLMRMEISRPNMIKWFMRVKYPKLMSRIGHEIQVADSPVYTFDNLLKKSGEALGRGMNSKFYPEAETAERYNRMKGVSQTFGDTFFKFMDQLQSRDPAWYESFRNYMKKQHWGKY